MDGLFITILCLIVIAYRLERATSCSDGQARELRFLSSLSFEGKYLANHVITTINVLDRDLCELRCYVESNCVSINYEVQPNASRTHKCDLNNSTHKEHDQDLESAPRYSYHGTNNHCGQAPCKNKAICQSGFTSKGYRCLCKPGFTGPLCENEPLLSITICEGNSGAITCQNGQRIQILDATYGRRNTQTCPHRADSNTNCLSPNSLSAVYNLCNNLVSCHLAPNNGMFGGDPCGGTYKYLLVEYQCV
ncbi:uncharacterized protein [Pocillopora verrucosa]|uniref:uncharacterized protein n=1 Tax=Pocillopora verrucosa TaxID=203993 RepID=UPI00334037AB